MSLLQRFKHGRESKLKSRKAIDVLFTEGKSIVQYPVKCTWIMQDMRTDAGAAVQCGVTAQKRLYPRATDRNRLKRQLRECWRLQQYTLSNENIPEGKQLHLFFIYTGKEFTTTMVLMQVMQKLLLKLDKAICEK